jgi:hypothetical protein
MKRILIQIDEETHQGLKARASREKRSIADVVRESIAANRRNRPIRSVDDFSFVGSGSSPADRKDRTSQNHDRALASAFSARRRKRK